MQARSGCRSRSVNREGELVFSPIQRAGASGICAAGADEPALLIRGPSRREKYRKKERERERTDTALRCTDSFVAKLQKLPRSSGRARALFIDQFRITPRCVQYNARLAPAFGLSLDALLCSLLGSYLPRRWLPLAGLLLALQSIVHGHFAPRRGLILRALFPQYIPEDSALNDLSR